MILLTIDFWYDVGNLVIFFFYFGICRHTGGLHIHGDASAKAALYKDRFLLLYQRVLRDSHFSKPAFHTEMSHYGSCEVGSSSPFILNVCLCTSEFL